MRCDHIEPGDGSRCCRTDTTYMLGESRCPLHGGAGDAMRPEAPATIADALDAARDAVQELAKQTTVPGPGGLRFDAGKIPLELLPTDALEEVAKVLEFGAKKYARRNWEKGIKFSSVVGPLLRHTYKWLRGEDNDRETGLNHMAHVACNALFLLAYILRGQSAELDNRKE